MLPNAVGALVYGGPHHPVNRRGSLALHIRHQVAVDIHRDRDRGVPKAFLHDLGVDIRSQHVAGVAVPQAVQGHPPFFQEGRNDVRQAPRLQRRAVGLGDDVPAIIRAHPELEQFLSLLNPPAAQLIDGHSGQGDRAALFAVKFIMVRDLEAEAQMAAKWQGRDLSNVRVSQNRMGKYFLDRARPALQEQLLQEFGAKLALAFGDEVDQLVAGITAKRAEPEPVQSIEGSAPLLALAPPDPTPPSPPDSPLSAKVEASKPRSAAQMTRFQLHVVQPRHKGARWGGAL